MSLNRTEKRQNKEFRQITQKKVSPPFQLLVINKFNLIHQKFKIKPQRSVKAKREFSTSRSRKEPNKIRLKNLKILT